MVLVYMETLEAQTLCFSMLLVMVLVEMKLTKFEEQNFHQDPSPTISLPFFNIFLKKRKYQLLPTCKPPDCISLPQPATNWRKSNQARMASL